MEIVNGDDAAARFDFVDEKQAKGVPTLTAPSVAGS